jgi:EamA-like transporter family
MFDSTEDAVTAAAWMKGIGLSVAASVIGGASKLAIRKSWLLEQEDDDDDENDVLLPPVTTTTTTTGGIFFGSSDETRAYALILPPHRSHLKTEDTATTTGTEDDALDTSDHVMEGLRLESQHSSGAPSEPESTILPTSKNWLPVALRYSGMIGMTFLNPLCCVLAMNYASPSILAPFSGLTLVWIVLLSSPLINEQPSHRQVSAAALIVLGEVVVAIFGDHTNGEGVTVSDVVSVFCS